MRRSYTRLALLCSVPSWVIARDIGQRTTSPFQTAFGKIYGSAA